MNTPNEAGTTSRTTSAVPGFTAHAVAWFAARQDPDPEGTARSLGMRVARHAVLGRPSSEPFTARMICEVFDADRAAPLPENLLRLYERYVELRLASRPASTRGLLQDLAYELATGAGIRGDYVRGFMLDRLEREQGRGRDPRRSSDRDERAQGAHVDDAADVPDAAGAVDELLRDDGLFTVTDGGHAFADPGLRDFLAAHEMAAVTPLVLTRREHLHRRRRWPWPDLRLHLFVAELWLDRGDDLSFWLDRLLRGAHRLEDAGFVAALIADGARVPPEMEARLVTELERAMSSPFAAARDWDRLADMLLAADARRALEVLEDVAGSTEERHLFENAMGRLRRLAPARVEPAVRRQLSDPRKAPAWRLEMARRFTGERAGPDRPDGPGGSDRPDGPEGSPEPAATVFLRLARDPHMRAHRVDAALEAARHDRSAAVGALASLAGTGGLGRLDPGGRFRAAECVLERDTVRGTEVMARLSRAGGGEVPARLRLAAARRVFEHDRALGHELLRELVRDTGAGDGPVRMAAARGLPASEHAWAMGLLASAAGGLAPEGRMAAAKALYETDHEAGRRAVAGIVGSSSHESAFPLPYRFTRTPAPRSPVPRSPMPRRPVPRTPVLRLPMPALPVPRLHAPHPKWSAEQRIKAAKITAPIDHGAHLRQLAGPEGGLDLPDRYTAAMALKAVDPPVAGERLAALARTWSWRTCSPQQRLELATTAARLNRRQGALALAAIAGRPGITPELRTSAARALKELSSGPNG